jgi:hypothetical protein
MRRYSAGEHLPWRIIRLRRAIVSHDAIINSAVICGSEGRTQVAMRPPLSTIQVMAGDRRRVPARPTRRNILTPCPTIACTIRPIATIGKPHHTLI